METRMLDFSNPGIQELIHNLKWKELDEFERVKAIYKRDAIHGPFACLRYSMQNTRFYNR